MQEKKTSSFGPMLWLGVHAYVAYKSREQVATSVCI